MTFTKQRLTEARQQCETAKSVMGDYVGFYRQCADDLPDALDMLERAAKVLDRLATGDYDDLYGCARCAARRWVEEHKG